MSCLLYHPYYIFGTKKRTASRELNLHQPSFSDPTDEIQRDPYLHNVFDKVGLAKTSYTFRRTVNNRLEEEGFTPSERALLLGHSSETNVKHYTNPHKNATLEKFRKTFCAENTKIIPNNVIEFKSKKPKNREFSGF